jgi:hypothetical protein
MTTSELKARWWQLMIEVHKEGTSDEKLQDLTNRLDELEEQLAIKLDVEKWSDDLYEYLHY